MFVLLLTYIVLMLTIISLFKKVTLSVVVLLMGVITALFGLLLRTDLLVFILFLFSMIGLVLLYVYLTKKFPINYFNKFFTLKSIVNLFVPPNIKKGKVYGIVDAYSKRQKSINGKYIIQDLVAQNGGTFITGASGSGKTFLIKNLIKQDIANHKNIIINEFKGDKTFVDEVTTFAKSNGYDVYVIGSNGANFNYDPFKEINKDAIKEAIMNMRKWDISGGDAHYKTSTELFIQKILNKFTPNPNSQDSYILQLSNFINNYFYGKEEFDAYNTTKKLLDLFITSEVGKSILKTKHGKEFRFSKKFTSPYIFIESFESANKSLATSFSSLLYTDILSYYNGNGVGEDTNISFYIDEFATLENSYLIKDILEKARSAKIATTIALQDINQIIINTNEAYLNSLLGTINTFVVFSGATKNTAEKISGIQIDNIENIIMSLKKPYKGHKPTALYISKYPVFGRDKSGQVLRFTPYNYHGKNNGDNNKDNNKSSTNTKTIRININGDNITNQNTINENPIESNTESNPVITLEGMI